MTSLCSWQTHRIISYYSCSHRCCISSSDRHACIFRGEGPSTTDMAFVTSIICDVCGIIDKVGVTNAYKRWDGNFLEPRGSWRIDGYWFKRGVWEYVAVLVLQVAMESIHSWVRQWSTIVLANNWTIKCQYIYTLDTLWNTFDQNHQSFYTRQEPQNNPTPVTQESNQHMSIMFSPVQYTYLIQ